MNPQQTRLNYVHHRMKTENLKKKVIGVKFILWQELSLVRKWVNKKEFNICVRFILGKVNNSLSW